MLVGRLSAHHDVDGQCLFSERVCQLCLEIVNREAIRNDSAVFANQEDRRNRNETVLLCEWSIEAAWLKNIWPGDAALLGKVRYIDRLLVKVHADDFETTVAVLFVQGSQYRHVCDELC